MTHLVIQQKKVLEGGTSESVSSAFITTLYNIANDSNLVYQSTDLKGDLSVDKTYQSYIDFLTTRYPNLTINATSTYLYFADPVVESAWANSTYGDGTGITATNAALVSSLSNTMFKNNTSITSFDELVQFGITYLPSDCFNGDTNLTSINTSKITDFADNCFKDSGITSIDLSSCNDHLGESAFRGCASLQSVIWPEQSFKMYKNVFYGCTSLQSVDLTYLNNSNANYAIRQDCFNGCTSLTSVIIGPNIKAIDGWAFNNCQSLSSINLSGIETISSSFGGCSSLTSIDLSSCITIGSDAFSGCTSLQTVKLGSNLTTIGSNAFKNCSALTTIQVPSAKLSDYQTSFPNIASMMVSY